MQCSGEENRYGEEKIGNINLKAKVRKTVAYNSFMMALGTMWAATGTYTLSQSVCYSTVIHDISSTSIGSA